MKLGADPKKIAILGGLLCIAGYFYISGSADEAPPSTSKSTATPAAGRPVPAPATERPEPVSRPRRASTSREFRPRLGGGKNSVDPTTVDPTLRLDLLAKVQEVKMEGGARNLFQFGQPPAPKVQEVKIAPKPIAPVQSQPMQPVANTPPPKPPPPPIPLKFYGYVSKNRATTDKRAFFLEGEEIFVAAEGETIKQRYKVVRIGINSAVVEDVQFSHQQTLPLEEQAG